MNRYSDECVNKKVYLFELMFEETGTTIVVTDELPSEMKFNCGDLIPQKIF